MLQMLEQNHEQAEEGHKRLRFDVRELEQRVASLEETRTSHDLHFGRIDVQMARPTEVSALRFTPAMVFTIIAICASVVGGAWGATYGIRSDVRDISTNLAAREKLDDERMAALKDQLGAMQRMQQLQAYEIQGFKETLAKLGRTK